MEKTENGKLFRARIAVAKDCEKLVELINGAYRGESGRRGWTTESDLIAGQRIDIEMVQELVSNSDGSIIVVEEMLDQGPSLRGCVHVRKDAGGNDRSYFGLLTIEVDQQRRGLGDLLLKNAEDHARTVFSAKVMRMYVISIRDSLISWYEKRGYRPTGETQPFPYGETRFGTPLRDDLQFIVMEKRLDEGRRPRGFLAL